MSGWKLLFPSTLILILKIVISFHFSTPYFLRDKKVEGIAIFNFAKDQKKQIGMEWKKIATPFV